MAAPPEEGWLQAGQVGRPHGLDGSFYVNRPRPELLELGMTVLVSGAPRRITRRAGTNRRPIVRLEGCEDRAGAQALGGETLRVRRTEAPVLEEEEWWAEDLERCEVHDSGRLVGVVQRLLAFPSCEVLEVARPGSEDALLVPLVRDAVRSVDIARRRIDVDLAFLGEGS